MHQSASAIFRPLLAMTMVISIAAPAFAGPGDVNSVNDGHNVAGGTYYNTPGDKTTFINSGGTGLHLTAGNTVTGHEVSNSADPTGSLTGNGGWVHFNAPGQVVRLDGNVNVAGFVNGMGVLGNGGKATVDAGYLYQNGHIFASGASGGVVQMNVGNMVMGQNASIDARGLTNAGGKVNIDSVGNFNMAKGAVIDTSGAVIGNYDTNVINISAGLVNLRGLVVANGYNAGQKGGEIRITSDTDLNIGHNGLVSANGANGCSNCDPTPGGDGGIVHLVAGNNITNNGLVQANGGKGGNNNSTAQGVIEQLDDCETVEATVGGKGANGGNGGQIYVTYNKLHNNGLLQAAGGNGGHGGNAIALNPHATYHYAQGGQGGNGGDGGYIQLAGCSDCVRNVDVDGGKAGKGGNAQVYKDDCGDNAGNIAVKGQKGQHGDVGAVVNIMKDCDTPPEPPVTPPSIVNNPPPRDGEAPYYKEKFAPNDMASRINPAVLAFDRSIFLARAPIPKFVVRRPVKEEPVAVPAVVEPVKPRASKVVPKRVVRGFW